MAGPVIDLKLVMYLIWGVGTVVVYAMLLRKRYAAYRAYHDHRARASLLSGMSLFITAICSFLAITAVFWGEPGTGLRGFLVAVALGAFFMAGVIKVRDGDEEVRST